MSGGKGSEMVGQAFRLYQKGRIEPIPFLEVQVFDWNDKRNRIYLRSSFHLKTMVLLFTEVGRTGMEKT